MQTHSADLPIDTSAPIGWHSVVISFVIALVWGTGLIFLLFIRIEEISPWELVLGVWFQAFLYTGLFIVAHDAMHQVIYPDNLRLNHAIGKIALFLYGFLSYTDLRKQHLRHHLYPASDEDPDFHDGQNTNLLGWYARFMLRYLRWRNLVAVTLSYHGIHHLLNIAHINLILFWACPSILSSFQLFYFGTFLPHRKPPQGYSNVFRSHSIYRPFWLSLLTCYHFGYHCEHHQYPDLPWWMLPAIAARDTDSTLNN